MTKNKTYPLPRKPIDRAFEKITELKIIIQQQNKIQTEMLDMIVKMGSDLNDLREIKEKEIIEKEKARAGWIW
jgi:hypothetical protein